MRRPATSIYCIQIQLISYNAQRCCLHSKLPPIGGATQTSPYPLLTYDARATHSSCLAPPHAARVSARHDLTGSTRHWDCSGSLCSGPTPPTPLPPLRYPRPRASTHPSAIDNRTTLPPRLQSDLHTHACALGQGQVGDTPRLFGSGSIELDK